MNEILSAAAGTAAFVAVLAAALAAPWAPAAWRRWRRSRVLRQPFPPAWRAVLRQRLPLFARLPVPLQQQLRQRIQLFVAEVPVIGCRGLVVTEEMRVLIAAQASLLALHRGADAWPQLRQVLLYPGPFVVDRAVNDGAGLQRAERRVLAGESWARGPVILSWPDVLEGAADPDDGRNVVIHEFAHQLDQETGAANGAPWLGGRRAARERWARVLGAAFAELQHRHAAGEPSVLDAYGAQEPAEFFAVACEAFFERPAALAEEQPALFAELRGYFRVDPRGWLPG